MSVFCAYSVYISGCASYVHVAVCYLLRDQDHDMKYNIVN